MTTEILIDKIESIASALICDLINCGYDTCPMVNGITSYLKENPRLWVNTHEDFYISWINDMEYLTLYQLKSDGGECVWYINLKGKLYPATICIEHSALDVLEDLYSRLKVLAK